MTWSESRYVDPKKKTSSKYIMTFLGMNIKFEVCCVWLQGGFKWMLNSVSLGIHANFICKAGDVTIEEVKLKALEIIKQVLSDRLKEVDLHLNDYQSNKEKRA